MRRVALYAFASAGFMLLATAAAIVADFAFKLNRAWPPSQVDASAVLGGVQR